ncbi:MAG: hypothetical protein J7539_13095, partial [Niabella sp.]|nr:hypothetical protein [Niabella sp.]
QPSAGKRTNNNSPLRTPFHSPSRTIGSIIRGFKTGVTKWFRYERAGCRLPYRKIWQRNYYDHIIRNDAEYGRIAKYIINTPSYWKEDRFC